MEEKSKPTVEEMIEAYRRYSSRIDEVCRELGPVKVDFSKLPLPRRMKVASRLQTLLAAIVVVFFCVKTIPEAYAMSPGADYAGTVVSVEFMLNNSGI